MVIMKLKELLNEFKEKNCKNCKNNKDCEGIVVDINAEAKCIKEIENK